MGDVPRQSLTCEPSHYIGSPGRSRMGLTSEPNLAVPRAYGDTEKRQGTAEWMEMAYRLSSDARLEAKSPLKEHGARWKPGGPDKVPATLGGHCQGAYPASVCIHNGVNLRAKKGENVHSVFDGNVGKPWSHHPSER
jgi:hypothetical protein